MKPVTILLSFLVFSCGLTGATHPGVRCAIVNGQPFLVPDDNTLAMAQYGVCNPEAPDATCDGVCWFVQTEGDSEVLVCIFPSGRVLYGIIKTAYSKQLSRVHILAEATVGSSEDQTLYFAKYSAPIHDAEYPILILYKNGIPQYVMSGDMVPIGEHAPTIKRVRKRIHDAVSTGQSNGVYQL